jgi:putative PIN family toxin of toxin-antitoxin system
MIYAVIDTNVIIAAQLTKRDDSATRKIVRAVFDGIVTPIVTSEILAEYSTVMSRPKFHIMPETISAVVGYFQSHGLFVTPIAYSEPLPDEKDRAFLEATLAMFDDNAALVTGNAKHFPPAPFVVSPAEFAAMLEPQSHSVEK